MKNCKATFLFILSNLMFMTNTSLKAQTGNDAVNGDSLMEIQLAGEFEHWLTTRDDWANLGYYRDDNAKLLPPKPGEQRVVFMGNSITEGWKTESPDFFKRKQYINRGISGQTTPQMLIRFRQDVVSLRPKAVVMLCGVNDIAGNTGPSTLEMIEDNIASMAEIATSNGINVILCSVLPAYDFPWEPGLAPAEKIVALNHWIKAYAEQNKHIYVDYFSSMADERNGLKSEFSEDGVHPNLQGYKVMEPLVEKAIAEAIGKGKRD